MTVRFRGRELTHPELGRNLLARFVDRVKEHGVAERTPLLEGKSMHITMASLHKPKVHEAPRLAERRGRRTKDRNRSGDDRHRNDRHGDQRRTEPTTATEPKTTTDQRAAGRSRRRAGRRRPRRGAGRASVAETRSEPKRARRPRSR